MDSLERNTPARRAARRDRNPDPGTDGARPWPALKALDFEGDDLSLTQAHLALLRESRPAISASP